MKTENFRRLLKYTSPVIARLSPRSRLFIAKLIPIEGVKTLFDPNSIRNYAQLGSKPCLMNVEMASGMSACVDINDIIGYRAALNRKWDDSSLDLIKQFKASETLYIDIGANTGLTSIPIAKLGYETIAFEPNPYALTQLANNLSLNSPVKYCLFPFALGDSSKNMEYIQLFSPPGNLGATSINPEWSPGLIQNHCVITPITSLDRIIGSIFTQEKLKSFLNILIKMDVEGFEDEVVLGARNLIDSGRPIILFENNPPVFPEIKKNRFWDRLVNYEFVVVNEGIKSNFDPDKRYENVLAIPNEKLSQIEL